MSLRVKQEVAEGNMQQSHRDVIRCRDTQNGVKEIKSSSYLFFSHVGEIGQRGYCEWLCKSDDGAHNVSKAIHHFSSFARRKTNNLLFKNREIEIIKP